jgi:predicted dinucleotide-binding enzyme
MQLIDTLGFDAVDAGSLTAGLALQPGGLVFGIAHSRDELSNLLRSAALRASHREIHVA